MRPSPRSIGLAQRETVALEGASHGRVVTTELFAELGERRASQVEPHSFVDLRLGQAIAPNLNVGLGQVSSDALAVDAVCPRKGVHVRARFVVSDQLSHPLGCQPSLHLAGRN